MMDWKKLLTPKRLGKTDAENLQFDRTPFQRDYDRLVFSSPFRRLKDKTQVFSLSTNDYIRTRLIHSLEVSCVGRSLGRIVGEAIVKKYDFNQDGLRASDFGDIVSAACLAHDIGNPPFGHSGEDAIRTGFESWYNTVNHVGEELFSKSQKADFDSFEGNAQGFRILTKLEMPPQKGGMQLTCPTLAAFTKYPRESLLSESTLNGYSGKSVKKHGFFQAEKNLFAEVAETVGLIRRHDNAAWWSRHPLAFLVEAADDICYSIVYVEDGHRMKYISFEKTEYLLNKIANIDINKHDESEEEKVKRLRAKAIHNLIKQATEIFFAHEQEILSGEFDKDLLSLSTYANHLEEIEKQTRETVFQHRDVVSIQIAGYEVLGKLFTEFVNAVLHNSKKSNLVYYMLPKECNNLNSDEDTYNKILRVTDYISGMTDSYATSLFQQFSGISLG
ncbi:deoxyguanosinetriphosphate triphosphohydrolase [Nostoc sp. ChiQUE01b]|uniref:deoxyguanosinetriphosphate triphosphohydrolase n=1 Tax=Nostoc sp. ChiQUE01b TaxID=3075376 RepID=UPI002AD2D570|nr:deoxyguanosinetriphosphate triphosphohydrolase [Nostoc sp. ChiQUE01b]MDZ8258273.1 deoxyguanosinetriphosphate triphosphohydrolase [Nostoc sp. ChiQUE01b]